jgi:hypothetical protein
MRIRAGLLVLAVGLALTGAADEGPIVDPFEVVTTFDRFSKMELWPGFDATAYPIAVFDGQRTLLFRHPDPPEEFRPLEGHEGIWVSPGKHPAMRWNSNADIGGTTTATLLLTIEPGRSVEYEAHILLHEVFHLFSKPLHPTWRPNEMWRYSYPMDDVDNYRQLLLEEEALARAVDSETDDSTASWTAAALAIRRQRSAKLSEEHRTFETALELQEGTAVYLGRSAIGIADDTERLREDRGPQGIRWRCYETGSANAVILDRLLPGWKQTLDGEPDTTFTELLEMAIAAREVTSATFTTEELTSVSNRAVAAISNLVAERSAVYKDFSGRGKRVVVRLADEDEQLGTGRFNPMAVEVLDHGEVLQTNFLTADHPRGEVRLRNPQYVRGSLAGVVALTTPASDDHPFLYGYRQIAISGFSGDPTVLRDGDAVTIEAEGLKLEFNGARIQSTEEELIVTVLPAAEIEE